MRLPVHHEAVGDPLADRRDLRVGEPVALWWHPHGVVVGQPGIDDAEQQAVFRAPQDDHSAIFAALQNIGAKELGYKDTGELMFKPPRRFIPPWQRRQFACSVGKTSDW